MGFYELASKDQHKEFKKYAKFGEKIKVSAPLEVKGKLYKEVIFYKKFLAGISGEVAGSVFLDSDNKKVEDEDIVKDLVNLSYFAEVLCDDESKIALNRALKVEGDLRKDEQDLQDIKQAFLILYKEGIFKEGEGLELENIIKEFYKLRRENNELMKNLLDKSKEITARDGSINDKFVNSIYDEYMDVLVKNFMKIRHLLTGKHLYNALYDKLKKYKKKFKVKLRSDNMNLLNKLEYTMLYFIKILNTYEPVLYMNKSQYERHLKNIEKDNIGIRTKIIR
ncbi:hypothetical protein ACOAKC_01795 [Hathewaya histolytica]|uniref:hypothetical protein n=1 Tax=Hathewaya histolytica TaxID=1498 RepID=UPI003B67ED6B